MLDLVVKLIEKENINAIQTLTLSSINYISANCEYWNYKLKIVPRKLIVLMLTKEFTLSIPHSRKLEVCVARRVISTTSMTPHLENKIGSRLDHCINLQAQKAAFNPKLQTYQQAVKLDTSLSKSERKRTVVIVFILSYNTHPNQKKKILSNHCDDRPDDMVNVFRYERKKNTGSQLARIV